MSMFFSLMLTLLPTRASLLAEGFSAWITLKKKVFKGKDKQDQVYRKTLGVIKSSMCFSYDKNFLGVFFTLKIDHGRMYFIVIVFEYWMNNSNRINWSTTFNINILFT